MVTKEQGQFRKDLNALCSYAKGAQQYSDINNIVDNLKGSILHRIEQMENTLALSRIIDEQLLNEVRDKIDRVQIDTYDEEGNQD